MASVGGGNSMRKCHDSRKPRQFDPVPQRKILLVSINILKNNDPYGSLDTFVFGHVPVVFLIAENADVAADMLETHPDIAVVIVDVSGEKGESGLALVRKLRKELANQTIRIVLLGEATAPGETQNQFLDYDVSDYRDISEINLPKLFTSLTIALQSYERLVTEEDNKQSLQTILDITRELYGVRSVEDFCLTILTHLQECRGLLLCHPERAYRGTFRHRG